MLLLRFIIIAALVSVAPLLLSAQALRGRVYIAGTETPIAGASVYYNASTNGTATADNGDFTLTTTADHIPIMVSCVGYTTIIVNAPDIKNFLRVYLTPRVQVLRTVVIGSDGVSRKEKEKMFMKVFLGTSSFAKGCSITNLGDVVLTYSKKSKTLTAECDTPLQIDNRPLGYHINYFLQTFTFSPTVTYFAGNFFYQDKFLPGEQRKVFKNRETAYQGSRLQFVRALWAGKLKAKGFKIYTAERDLNKVGYRPTDEDSIVNAYRPLVEDSIVRIDTGRKFMDLKARHLLIVYDGGPTTVTQTNPVLITRTGYYAPGPEWSEGNMADQRIGDYLPYEYWPDADLDEKPIH